MNITVSDLRKDIYNVFKSILKTNEPLTIINRNSKEGAVLISMKYWEDIQETLFLLSNKDAREVIQSELSQPIEEGEEINWRDGE
jgi:prevent-host-death family protein